jgi:hypothetical protein
MAVTSQQIKSGASLALISVIVGVLSSIVALYIQVSSVVDSYIGKKIKQDFAPVGTVVSSILSPIDFAVATGETEGDDIKNRKWILADGESVLGTEYSKTTHNKVAPDLRGMFLRGIDVAGIRHAGEIQPFATARPSSIGFTGTTSSDGMHSHSGGAGFSKTDRFDVPGGPIASSGPSDTGKAGDHTHKVEINAGGDEETRPVNVAVYFYIKIN